MWTRGSAWFIALAVAGACSTAVSCALVGGNLIGGPLSVDGPLMVSGPLTVGGPATVYGPVRARKIVVGGPVFTLPGGHTPGSAGQAVNGPLAIGGPLTVLGPLTVDGTLTIGGPLTAESSAEDLDQPAAASSEGPMPSQYSQTPTIQ